MRNSAHCHMYQVYKSPSHLNGLPRCHLIFTGGICTREKECSVRRPVNQRQSLHQDLFLITSRLHWRDNYNNVYLLLYQHPCVDVSNWEHYHPPHLIGLLFAALIIVSKKKGKRKKEKQIINMINSDFMTIRPCSIREC